MSDAREPLAVRARLDAPHLPAEHRIHAVLAAYARRRGGGGSGSARAGFRASYFGLEHVRAYAELPQTARDAVLARCSAGVLAEAYFIEKAGLGYCAKLVLLSHTTEERMAFSQLAADEAAHLELIGHFVDPSGLDPAGDPFLALLAELIETGGKQSLILLLQVVLEGWGLQHYRSLQRAACDPPLRAAFAAILRDEALHHATGKALFQADALAGSELEFAREAMLRFLAMVQAGPQRVAHALEAGCGGFTRTERVRAFAELRSEQVSAAKLAALRELLQAAAPPGFVDALADRGAFVPSCPEVCADLSGT